MITLYIGAIFLILLLLISNKTSYKSYSQMAILFITMIVYLSLTYLVNYSDSEFKHHYHILTYPAFSISLALYAHFLHSLYKPVSKGRFTFIYLIPGLTLFISILNEALHLVWSDFSIVYEPYSYSYTRGIWYYIHSIHVLFLFGSALKGILNVFKNKTILYSILFIITVSTLGAVVGVIINDTTLLSYTHYFLSILILTTYVGVFHIEVDRYYITHDDDEIYKALDLGYYVIDSNDIVVYMSNHLINSLSKLPEYYINKSQSRILREIKFVKGSTEFLYKNNKYFVLEKILKNKGQVVLFKNVTELYNKNKELETINNTDYLTKLRNRDCFYSDFEDINNFYGGYFSYYDIDNFKSINDTYGHLAGDKALIKFGEHLSANKGLILYRMSGDEFISFSNNKIDNIKNKFSFEYNNNKIDISFSVGLIDCNEFKLSSMNEYLDFADHLMYTSKINGKSTMVAATEEKYKEFKNK